MANIKVQIEKTDGTYLEFGSQYLKEVSTTSQLSSSPSEIGFSVLSRTGTIRFQDINGVIKQAIVDGQIDTKSAKVNIYLKNNLIAQNRINESSYNYSSNEFTVELSDELATWDLIQYKGYPVTTVQTNWYSLLLHMLTSSGYEEYDVEEMCSENIMTGTTVKDYLSEFISPVGYLQPDTLKNSINKILQLAFLSIIVNSQGKIKIGSALPLRQILNGFSLSSMSVDVPTTAQYSKVDIDLCSKLKYRGIKATVYKVEIDSTEIQHFPDGGGSETFSDIDESMYNPNNYPLIKKTLFGIFNCTFAEIEFTVDPTIHNKCESFSTSINYFKFNGLQTVESSKELPGVFVDDRLKDEDERLSSEQNCYLYVDKTIGSSKWYLYIPVRVDMPLVGGIMRAANRVKDFSTSFIGAGAKLTTEDSDYGTSDLLEYKNNELLQSGTSVFGVESDYVLPDFVNYMVNNSYSEGSLSGKMTIACRDYYRGATKIIDWSNGEIVQTGGLLKIGKNTSNDSILTYNQGDPYYWQATSVTLRHKACPYLDIEFQEVGIGNKNVDANATYYTITGGSGVSHGNIIIYYRDKVWNSSSGTSLQIKAGDSIMITYASPSNYKITYLIVRQNNETIKTQNAVPCFVTVNGNISISATETATINP